MRKYLSGSKFSLKTRLLLAVAIGPAFAPTAVFGQTADVQGTAGKQGGGLGEIVVTARRDAENVQHVPVSVQVVTGNELQKLSITSVQEVSKLAPGLTLIANGSDTEVTLRGVTWQPGSGTPATPVYFNEIPFDPAQTITSLFDVGQIEVLRGPQGTTRGAPSISGAITISTRKPDLREFGGFAQGLYGSGDHKDFQAALNIPIVKDVLAVRLATNIENSDGDRVRSVNSDINPRYRDRSYRATVLFKPTDTITIQGMYQRRRTLTREFIEVAGPGSPGFPGLPGALPAIPANYNGPALTVKDRASVQDMPNDLPQHIDLLTLNASWDVLGQTLSYNYGRQYNRSPVNYNANDSLNIVPGFEAFSEPSNLGLPKFSTQEIRLSSRPDEDRPFDYDIGWFSKHSNATLNNAQPNYLPGAFGSPATAEPGEVTVPNPRYVLNSSTNIRIGQVFDSFYGNLRFHIDRKTELSGGLSIVRDRVPVDLDVRTFSAFTAFANPLLPSRDLCPFAAPGAIPSPVYTSGVVCEIGLPDGFANQTQHNNDKYSKALYNFSLSHRFTDDLLAYATTGTSYRSGLPAIANPGLPSDLITPKPETATSYELGVKTSIGPRLRINADIFQINYKNQLTSFEGVNYYSNISQSTAQTSVAFYRNINARVRGAEIEIDVKPIDPLSLSVNASYSKIKSQGGSVPCNDASRPITSHNVIDFCASPKGQVLNQEPPFQATANGDYEISINDYLGGYFRFNVNYRGRNPGFGNFRTDAGFKSTPSYALVDLFAGVTGNKGGWNLGFYAKNVFNKQIELNRVATVNAIYTQFSAPAGYDVIRASLPREVGVTLRYAFGSR